MWKSVVLYAAILLLLVAGCSPAAATEPNPTPGALNPLDSPQAFLAQETGIPVDQITLLHSEKVDWDNACLGAAQPGEACAQVITPGYQIALDTPQGVYEIHTNESGSYYRILPPEGTPVSNIAVSWDRSGGIAGICQRLTIENDGTYRLEDCRNDKLLSQGNLEQTDQNAWKQIATYLQEYANYEWKSSIPEGSADMFNDQYTFNGKGSKLPSADEQTQFNNFLADLVGELVSTGPQPTGAASGIEGQALVGPVCPVVSTENQTKCADQPYQAVVIVMDKQNKVVTQFQTDETGHFKVELPPGTYTLNPQSSQNAAFPRAGIQQVTIQEGEFTQVVINFDSGIR